jgi:acylphosphatase
MGIERIAVQIEVRGRVQGVGYRAFTRRLALKHGLAGYVCNQTDGSVRAWLEGHQDDVANVIDRMRLGPPGAQVVALTTVEQAPTGGHSTFKIHHI